MDSTHAMLDVGVQEGARVRGAEALCALIDEVATDAASIERLSTLVADTPVSSLNTSTGLMKFTPLHAAAERGHLPSVELLLAAGSNGGADVDGATPLHHASAHGHVATVVALLRASSSPLAAENLFGDTALHWACAKGRAEVVELLLDAGSDPHKANKRGWTPLHHAARNHHEAVTAALLARDVNVDCATADAGCTALHLASAANALGVVQLLLAAGAKATAHDLDGRVPVEHNPGSEALRSLLGPPPPPRAAAPPTATHASPSPPRDVLSPVQVPSGSPRDGPLAKATSAEKSPSLRAVDMAPSPSPSPRTSLSARIRNQVRQSREEQLGREPWGVRIRWEADEGGDGTMGLGPMDGDLQQLMGAELRAAARAREEGDTPVSPVAKSLNSKFLERYQLGRLNLFNADE